MKVRSKSDELIPGLARVPRRTDDLALDVGEHALVLGVGAGVGHPDRSSCHNGYRNEVLDQL